MTEVSKSLRNIFFRKKPRILKHEVGFFLIEKVFNRFSNIRQICVLRTSGDKILSKIRQPFLPPPSPSSIHHPPTSVTRVRDASVTLRLDRSRLHTEDLCSFYNHPSTNTNPFFNKLKKGQNYPELSPSPLLSPSPSRSFSSYPPSLPPSLLFSFPPSPPSSQGTLLRSWFQK